MEEKYEHMHIEDIFTDEGELEELAKKHPLLENKSFRKKFPGILKVVAFIDSTYDMEVEATGTYDLFDQVGVENTDDYLQQLRRQNPEAVESYGRIFSLLNVF